MFLSSSALVVGQVYENSKEWVNVSSSAVLESDLDSCSYEGAISAHSYGMYKTALRLCMKARGWHRY
jgi:hypothetical protein